MPYDAEVIIAGAGPAGSLAAYELAVRGVSVLVIEKSQFPRYKVCGAGLTHKILSEIPFDLSPVFETAVHTVRFSHRLGEVFERRSELPMIYCTMRDKLDSFLLEKAVQAGARVIHAGKVTEIFQDEDTVTVKTKDQVYQSRLLIGADGASGIVARSAGLRTNIMQGLAWEAEIKTDASALQRFSETVFLDWGTFPGGYAWLFPKGDHISVGVGGPAALSKHMMPYYRRFMEYLSPEIKVTETYSLKSWPIPVRRARERFHNGRILITGDAGGLTDPLTGEGIFYAVRSGRMAAHACVDYLRGEQKAISEFSDRINDELVNELLEAERIKNIFNTIPGKIHRWVKESDRGWRAFGKILRGDRNYADIRRGFGRWRFLWTTATLVSGWIYKWKERQFSNHG